MAENDSSNDNDIVKDMNYTPNASAIEKASSSVSDSENDETIQKVSSNTDLLMSDTSSNVLGVLKNIEKQQSAARINDTRNLSRIIDLLDSKSDRPVRNRYHEMTEMIEVINSLKNEIKSNKQNSVENESDVRVNRETDDSSAIIEVAPSKDREINENDEPIVDIKSLNVDSIEENDVIKQNNVYENTSKEELQKIEASNNVYENNVKEVLVTPENDKETLKRIESTNNSSPSDIIKQNNVYENNSDVLNNTENSESVYNEEGTLTRIENVDNETDEIVNVDNTRQEILDELRKLNENAASMGNNITSGFQASMDEAEKKAALDKKVAEIQKQRDKENQNVLTRQLVTGSVQVSEALETGLSDAMSGVTTALGFAMGDNDKKLLAGVMMGVTAFKAAISGFKKTRERWNKAGKWFESLGKNSQGEKGSTLEEKTLAAYNDQLKEVKASHDALVGIGGNLNLSSEQTYQDLMVALTTDVEKDLTELLKVFNNGPARDGTTDELIADMPEVAETALDFDIDDIKSAVITPTELLEELVDQNREMLDHKGDEVSADKKQDEKEDNNRDKAKLSSDDEEKNKKREKLNTAFEEAQSGNDKKKKDKGKDNGGFGAIFETMKSMKGIVDIIRTVSKVFNVLKTVFNVMRIAVMGLGVALSALGAFIFSIPGAIILAIAAVGIALYVFWEDLTGMWDDLSQWFSDGWDSLVSSWNGFWDSFLDPVFEAWDGFINWISESIDKLLWMIQNPLDAAADIATGDNDNYDEYKAEKAEEEKQAKLVAEEKAKQQEMKEADEEAAADAEWEELSKPDEPKPKNERYTEEEMEGLSSMAQRPMKEHNRRISRMESQARLDKEWEEQQAAEKQAKWIEDNKNKKLPLKPAPEEAVKDPYDFDIMSVLGMQDEKDAASIENTSVSTNVSVQNNNSTSNVSSSGGGASKTYIYSGIVPTAPGNGVIVGATD